MTAQQKLDALHKSRLWLETKAKYPHLADFEVDLWIRYYLHKTKNYTVWDNIENPIRKKIEGYQKLKKK